MQGRALWVTSILLLATLAFAPVRADAPLVADAGDSQIGYNGAALAVRGRAIGGAAPYTYAWSWNGDATRFADPTAAHTSFATAGLPPGDLTLTLTITDDLGAVASDTVRVRADDAPILVRRNVSVTFGVPDEIVGMTNDGRQILFTVPPGLAKFIARLDWQSGAFPYDWDFELLDPNGVVVSGGQGDTQNKPEIIVIQDPTPGGWTARVKPFLSGQGTGNLTIQGFPLGSLPSVTAFGPYKFGSLDPQALLASASGGSAPVALAWDLDGDGIHETPGASVTAALSPGTHDVRVRATDAAGFEVATTARVVVKDADTILRLRCGNDPTTPFWAMEFTSTKGTCWIHGGHHTYFVDGRYALRNVSGYVFTVEQQFSPPTEYDTDSPGATPLHFQLSENGIDWNEVAHGEYRFLPAVTEGSLAIEQRQRVDILAQGSGETFRFVRVHEPLSAAQGLSGYLDHSELDIEADILGPAPAPTLAPATRAYDCTLSQHMEAFFVTHPCTFGGIDRYDAPSFWHTYPLGDGARLDRITGEFVLLPWRLDDFTQGAPLTNATNISAFVQVSQNGVHWTDVATVPAGFGNVTVFDVHLDDANARFVRLFPDYHARYDQTGSFAPNHHPKGYFVDSRLVVEGALPVVSS